MRLGEERFRHHGVTQGTRFHENTLFLFYFFAFASLFPQKKNRPKLFHAWFRPQPSINGRLLVALPWNHRTDVGYWLWFRLGSWRVLLLGDHAFGRPTPWSSGAHTRSINFIDVVERASPPQTYACANSHPAHSHAAQPPLPSPLLPVHHLRPLHPPRNPPSTFPKQPLPLSSPI